MPPPPPDDEPFVPKVGAKWELSPQVTLRSTYAEGLGGLVDPETRRVHTTFEQTIAATGRLSSRAPNLQNIPIRTPLGRRIRRAFVAGSADRLLVAADYSQIELRVLAHVSQDPALLDAFRSGADIHRRTAAAGFGVAESAVTREQRDVAKMLNFGIIYGMSDFGLAWRMQMPREEAQRFIDEYFKRYGQVRRYVLVFMPLTSILFGVGIGLWRRDRSRRGLRQGTEDGCGTRPFK